MEMHLDILRAIHEGEEKPTRIMSKSNMTWSQLKNGLEFLSENMFIEENTIEKKPLRRRDKRTKNRYTVTEKGDSVLRYFRKEHKQVETLISSL